MTIYRLDETPGLTAPVLVAALDGWVDAGTAATTAAERLAEGGSVIATFDGDLLFDYRARRPTLEIIDGRLAELTWPAVRLQRARIAERDLLILSGAEPDFRWTAFSGAVIELARQLGVTQSISLGAIPAAVPHTRAVPIIGTASEPGLLHGSVQPGPTGHLRVPAAAISVLEMALAEAGIPTVGYFAQVPHYVSGPYPVAALALIQALERHLGVEIPSLQLTEEASQMRANLDAAAAADTSTKAYIERLEAMVDEQRQPAGDELISEIERFLRARGSGGPGGPGPSGEGGGLPN